ncbi:hypothetical protein YC2023_012662 [Brassica napus]
MKKRDYFLLLGIIILLFLSGSLASAPSSISPARLVILTRMVELPSQERWLQENSQETFL